MGTGDAHLKKGDHIMVCGGASFPMIVRSILNVLIGPAELPNLDIDALLEDKKLLGEDTNQLEISMNLVADM